MADLDRARSLGLEILHNAGIAVGGDQPRDIVVHDDRFWARVVEQPELGLGESYQDGWWDANQPRRVHRRGADPRPALAGEAPARVGAARRQGTRNEPPDRPAGPQKRGRPLQHRKRPLRADARQAHDLLVRLLATLRGPGPGPGGQARPDLPQAAPRAGHASARHRLRLGRLRPVRGRRARCDGRGYHSGPRAGPCGPGRLRGPARRDPGVRLPRRTGPLRPDRVDRDDGARRPRATSRPSSSAATTCCRATA